MVEGETVIQKGLGGGFGEDKGVNLRRKRKTGKGAVPEEGSVIGVAQFGGERELTLLEQSAINAGLSLDDPDWR